MSFYRSLIRRGEKNQPHAKTDEREASRPTVTNNGPEGHDVSRRNNGVEREPVAYGPHPDAAAILEALQTASNRNRPF